MKKEVGYEKIYKRASAKGGRCSEVIIGILLSVCIAISVIYLILI